MLGAITGDVVGSVYEWDNIKHKDFNPLFSSRAFFTDDSVTFNSLPMFNAVNRTVKEKRFFL